MKGRWVTIGPTQTPYCEVVTDDSGMIYVSVRSGEVRTSDYLSVDDAERVARALLEAMARARAATGVNDE